jgi:DNA-binding transcriptional MerR regulator
VLRFWETQFPGVLRPVKSSGGQRVYSRKDVENAAAIQRLLYVERYTIEGARRALRHGAARTGGEPEQGAGQLPLPGTEPGTHVAEGAMSFLKEMEETKAALAAERERARRLQQENEDLRRENLGLRRLYDDTRVDVRQNVGEVLALLDQDDAASRDASQ